jgi:folate-dependent phosphoribosylglycinamide formyltransferase PurN
VAASATTAPSWISNGAQAAELERARAVGIERLVLDRRQFGSRDESDRRLAEELRARRVPVVCLAGLLA